MVRFELPDPPEDINEYTVWDALEEYLLSMEAGGASHKTIKAYRAGISDFLKFIGKKRVGEITSGDFTKWKLHRLRNGFPHGSKDKKKIQMTLHYYSLYVRSFLKWLGIIDKAPAVSRPRGRRTLKSLSPAEVYALFQASRDILDMLIVSILFETGLRAQELLSLEIEDIDLENREIRVRGAKYGEERAVFIGPTSYAILKDYLKNADGPKLIPLSYSGLYKRLKTLAKRAGVDASKVRPHVLRHTFATEALKRGLNLIALQSLLGHKDIKTTQIYLHLMKEDLKKAYLKIFSRELAQT